MLITIDDVQPWLETSKLRINTDDELPEEPIMSEFVLARLASRLDVSTWIDESTTPELVRYIIGMLVAAMRYNKYYSETADDGGNPYADKLEAMAENLIVGILEGDIIIIGVPNAVSSTGTIAFYPTDIVGLEFPEEARRFSMGKIF